jgi:CRP-like cAMP-binding protein
VTQNDRCDRRIVEDDERSDEGGADMENFPMSASEDPRLGTQFASTATRLDLGAGRRLCVQGARRQEFGRVVSGRARVLRDGAVVGQLGAGDHFGEFTVLRGLPSPVTIVADEPMTIDVVTGAEFRGTVGADDATRDAIEHTLDARIRDWVSTADVAAMAERAIA